MDDNFRRQLVDEDRNLFHVSDSEGNTSRFVVYDGHKYMPYHFKANGPERLIALKNIECRDDDILLMMYPKSGTHWLKNIVSMIVRENTDYVDTAPVLDFCETNALEEISSPRILVNHLLFDCLPDDYKNGKAKIIFMSRNPKDVVTSMFFHAKKLTYDAACYRGNWDGFLNMWLKKEVAFGSWFEQMKMWDRALKENPELKVLFLRYEDMKEDLFGHVKQIARFLNLERDDTFLRRIENKCTFRHMQTNALKQETGYKDDNNFNDGVLPTHIYRQGNIDDWKNYFTVAQSERFDAVYRYEMEGYDMLRIFTANNAKYECLQHLEY